MKAINLHVEAVVLSFKELGKGNFWLYLVPSLAIGLCFWIFSEMVSGFFGFLDYASDVPLVGSYLNSGVQATKGFFGFLGDFIYEFFILTILSPVYCLLSEAVDEKLTGQKFPFDFGRLVLDFFRMILIVIISTFLYFTLLGTWWMLSWILNLDILDKAVSMLISAFFFGFSFYDFSLERYKIGTWKSWGFSFENISYMVLTGLIFVLLFEIPFVGVMMAPFLSTIICTIVFLKMHQKIPTANG